MSGDNQDEKSSECEGGAATHRVPYRPLEVRPSVGRTYSIDGTIAEKGNQV